MKIKLCVSSFFTLNECTRYQASDELLQCIFSSVPCAISERLQCVVQSTMIVVIFTVIDTGINKACKDAPSALQGWIDESRHTFDIGHKLVLLLETKCSYKATVKTAHSKSA